MCGVDIKGNGHGALRHCCRPRRSIFKISINGKHGTNQTEHFVRKAPAVKIMIISQMVSPRFN